MRISIEAKVFPTEDPEMVARAILNLFPDAVSSGERKGAVAMASVDAGTFFRRISEQKIRDTARSVLLASIRGERLEFCLNKQAALSGKVNLTRGDSILGDLEVTMEIPDPEWLVDTMLGAGQ